MRSTYGSWKKRWNNRCRRWRREFGNRYVGLSQGTGTSRGVETCQGIRTSRGVETCQGIRRRWLGMETPESRREQEEGGGAGPSREPKRDQEQGGGAGL